MLRLTAINELSIYDFQSPIKSFHLPYHFFVVVPKGMTFAFSSHFIVRICEV